MHRNKTYIKNYYSFFTILFFLALFLLELNNFATYIIRAKANVTQVSLSHRIEIR